MECLGLDGLPSLLESELWPERSIIPRPARSSVQKERERFFRSTEVVAGSVSIFGVLSQRAHSRSPRQSDVDSPPPLMLSLVLFVFESDRVLLLRSFPDKKARPESIRLSHIRYMVIA
jgi:hypothetical protein